MSAKAKKPPARPGKPKAPEVGASAPPPAAPQPAGLVAPPVYYRGTVALAKLRPSPTNPRKTFDAAKLEGLAASIRQVGVAQDLVVRPHGAAGGPAPKWSATGLWQNVEWWEVVAGERRRRAAGLAGLYEVPVKASLLTDRQVRVIQAVENDQREDVLPSERAASYAGLAADGMRAEDIAAETGLPLSAVRDLVRLARLPGWALAAVDAGTLSVTTAALVAKVPGEQSRAWAANCVVTACRWPGAAGQTDDWRTAPHVPEHVLPLSYRDTKRLLSEHFTRQLKDAPFSRKAFDVLPAAGSCEACPKRAGNDAEAKADGVRADVCLDPDCYRAKVEAYRAAEVSKAAAKGVEEADLGGLVGGYPGNPPRGWCDLAEVVWKTELHPDFPVAGKSAKRDEKLGKVLGENLCPQKYLAFGPGGKAVTLVKTADARKALQAAGVIPKPEKREKEKPAASPSAGTGSNRPGAATKTPPKPAGPSEYEVAGRAALVAAKRCRDMLLANAESVAEMGRQGGPDTDAVFQALAFVARVVVRDWADVGSERLEVLDGYFKLPPGTRHNSPAGLALVAAVIDDMTPAQLVGFLLAAAAHVVLGDPRKDEEQFRTDLIGYADTTLDECREAARRELTGEPEPAHGKINTCPRCGRGTDLMGGHLTQAECDAAAKPAPVPLAGLDLPASVFDLLTTRPIPLRFAGAAWACCEFETPELAALPPRNRLMAWLVKLGAKAKPADQAAAAIAAALPVGAGKAVAS